VTDCCVYGSEPRVTLKTENLLTQRLSISQEELWFLELVTLFNDVQSAVEAIYR
jgi:hypothetical protein